RARPAAAGPRGGSWRGLPQQLPDQHPLLALPTWPTPAHTLAGASPIPTAAPPPRAPPTHAPPPDGPRRQAAPAATVGDRGAEVEVRWHGDRSPARRWSQAAPRSSRRLSPPAMPDPVDCG